MLNKDEVLKLRAQSGDTSVFNNLMQTDPKFRSGVENVKRLNPNMGDFEKEKLPSTMIDLYYGIKPGTPEPTTSRMMINATREQPSALTQLKTDPLGFAGQTLKNVPRSGKQLLGAIGTAGKMGVKEIGNLVTQPIQTLKKDVKGIAGVGANTLETIASLAGVKNAEQIFNVESEDIASAIGDFYVKRYGSIEAAANTLREDPVGFMSDAATLISGLGGAIKGGAIAAGELTGAATRTATELSTLGRALRATEAAGDAVINAGVQMEPVVIAGKGVFMTGRGVAHIVSPSRNAEALIHSAIKLQPNQMRNFMKENVGAGETPAGYLLRKGISGTREGILSDLEAIARKSKDTVDSELSTVRQTFDVYNDVPAVHQALTEVQKFYEGVPGLEEELATVKALAKKDRLNLSEINQAKRMMDDTERMFSKSSDPLMSARAQGLRNIRDGVKTFIEETAQQKGLQDIRLLNKDTQLSHALIDDMEHAIVGKYSNNVLTLGDWMATGVGATISSGNPLITAGVVLGRRLFGSVYFKTTLAKYINKLSLEELGKLTNVMRGAKQTKEVNQIIRKVVSQTAEDMKQTKIGQVEDAYGASKVNLSNPSEGLPESPMPAPNQGKSFETSPTTLPEAPAPVNTLKDVEIAIKPEKSLYGKKFNITYENKKVGTVQYHANDGGRYVEIDSIFLKEKSRGIGIGTKALEQISSDIKKSYPKAEFVLADIHSKSALKVFQKVFGSPDSIGDDIRDYPIEEATKMLPDTAEIIDGAISGKHLQARFPLSPNSSFSNE